MKLQDHLHNEIILSISIFFFAFYFQDIFNLPHSEDLAIFLLIISPGILIGLLLKPNKYWHITACVVLAMLMDYGFSDFKTFSSFFTTQNLIEKIQWMIEDGLLIFLIAQSGIVIGFILRKKVKKEKMTDDSYNAVILFFTLIASFFAGAFGGYAISTSHSTTHSVIMSLLIYFLPGFIYYLSSRKNTAWRIIGFLSISTMITISSDIISLTDDISFERYIQEITNQIPIILTMVILGFSFGYIVKDFIKKNSKNERF